MPRVKNALIKVKNHWKDHQFAYGMTAVAIGAIWLQQANRKAFYKFLVEKGIDPMEYYIPEYYEELKGGA